MVLQSLALRITKISCLLDLRPPSTQSLSISSLVGDLASPVLDDILHEREVENWMCSINAVDS